MHTWQSVFNEKKVLKLGSHGWAVDGKNVVSPLFEVKYLLRHNLGPYSAQTLHTCGEYARVSEHRKSMLQFKHVNSYDFANC